MPCESFVANNCTSEIKLTIESLAYCTASQQHTRCSPVHNEHNNHSSRLTATSLLPEVLSVIIQHLGDDVQCLRPFRLTCRAWRAAADASMQELRLRAPRIQQLISQFPALHGLDLQACSHVRNSHLEVLASSVLGRRLTSLKLGNMWVPQAGKIKLSNQALVSIAQMTALRSLSMCNCWAITDTGMGVLSSLTSLNSLTILDCPRLTDAGLQFLTALSQLSTLAISGMRVSDVTLLELPSLPHLQRLHLCSIGASASGLRHLLTGLTHQLTELVLTWMALSQETLALLSNMQQLHTLKLLECRGCPCSDMLAVAASLSTLRSCHVHNVEGILGGVIGDRVKQLVLATPALEDVSFIGIYGPAMRPVLHELVALHHLRRLGLGAPSGKWVAQLSELSLLTNLTALQVKCAHFRYSGQWTHALAHLHQLHHLDLSHNFPTLPAVNPLLPPSWSYVHDQLIADIAACKALGRVDLSFTTITSEQLRQLLHALPFLTEFALYGVPLDPDDVQQLRSVRSSLRLDV